VSVDATNAILRVHRIPCLLLLTWLATLPACRDKSDSARTSDPHIVSRDHGGDEGRVVDRMGESQEARECAEATAHLEDPGVSTIEAQGEAVHRSDEVSDVPREPADPTGEVSSEADGGTAPTPDALAEVTPPPCPEFVVSVQAGLVASDALIELSGLAVSAKNAGVLWAHNDAGDKPRFFALGVDGRHLGILTVSGAGFVDWEAMAIGPGFTPGQFFLYAGDIGDNGAIRKDVRIYRVLEPDVDPSGEPFDETAAADTLRVVYPDGAHNAEAFFVDPLTGDLFIVTKENPSSLVFRIPAPFVPGATVEAEKVAEVGFASPTGGDISAVGDEILLRGYGQARLWRRVGGEDIAAAFSREACPVPLVSEPQGEAIAFAPDGSGYFSSTEGPGGVAQAITFYARE